MKIFAPAALAALLLGALLCGVEAQVIDQGQLKPGASITLDMPKLGNSWRSDGQQPVQMRVILPDNFTPAEKHPVIVHLGYAAGNVDGADIWNTVMNRKDFICVGVDYCVGGHKSGCDNALAALEVLKQACPYDEENVLLTGMSSGAYSIANTFRDNNPGQARFAGFILIIGGTCNQNLVAKLGKRPILLFAGENDQDPASAGKARVEALKEMHAAIQNAGGDSTLIIQPGAGHEWPENQRPLARAWIYEKLPLFASFTNAMAAMRNNQVTGRPALLLANTIATSRYELPGKEDAIKRLRDAGLQPGEVPPLKTGGMRTWTSSAGKTVEAEFVELAANGAVVLRNGNGGLNRISLESLGEQDRQFVQELRAFNEGMVYKQPRALRLWTSASGATLEARYIEVSPDNKVRLEKADGRRVEITINSLSPDDQQYITDQKASDK